MQGYQCRHEMMHHLDHGWISTGALDGSQSGPWMELHFGLGWIAIWALDGSQPELWVALMLDPELITIWASGRCDFWMALNSGPGGI